MRKPFFRKGFWTAVLLVVLVPCLCLRVSGQESTQPYIRQILNYYRYYQQQAWEEMGLLLEQISSIDAREGEVWKEILESWNWANGKMEVHADVLPDGLPEDDSLCIVVLGYQLEADGSMQPELVSRLEVALASAQKYPNAFLVCTGGQTASVEGVTEAGQMAAWLRAKGVDKDRLILEERSLSTTQNAIYTYALLCREYSQVRHVAVITSDYHVRQGCLMFQVQSLYGTCYQGGQKIDVVGNAVCQTTKSSSASVDTQARGIAQIAGIDLSGLEKPEQPTGNRPPRRKP